MKYLSFSLFTLIFLTCNNVKDFNSLKNQDLQLLKIDPGTGAPSTIPGDEASLKYTSSYSLSTDEKNILVDELSKESNFQAETRRCQPYPQYAIKSKDKLLLLLDLETCPKMYYYGGDSLQVKDLDPQNTLTKAIGRIIDP